MRVPLDWVQEFVEARARPEKLAHALTMSGLEVESVEKAARTAIIEVGVTPNRADCLSVRGIAREISAVTGARLKRVKPRTVRGSGSMASSARVSVRAGSRCPRYAARVIRGVKIGASPQWMAARLAACGMRSINNIVDATNYVMIETGQPLHAFDLSRISGSRIVVRTAGRDSEFTTLDGSARKLAPDDLLICDAEGPVALAGIMGGENSEVKESTVDLLLESAYFEPSGVRRTSRRLGLSTESSKRFERGIDPEGVPDALHMLTEMIVRTAGGVPSADWVDIYPKRVSPRRLSLSVSEANALLGSKLTAVRMAAVLKRLGLGVPRRSSERLSVTVPTFRPDLCRPVDLIEEIARVNGYEAIEETMPCWRMKPLDRPRFSDYEDVVRAALTGAGMDEAVLYGFVSEAGMAPFSGTVPEPIRVTNPLSSEQAVMATSLMPNLADAVRRNLMNQRRDVRLFALQRTYHRTKALDSIEEPRVVAGMLTGSRYPGSWDRSKEQVDFYDAKLCVESVVSSLNLSDDVIYQRGPAPSFLHPGRFAYLILGGSRAGFVGQIHPDLAQRLDMEGDVYAFELQFELFSERAHAQAPRFEEFSRFPFVTRDIAVVLDESVPLYEVEKVISDSGVAILDDVRLFDLFRGGALPDGKKSMGIALRFSRGDRTLTDDEVSSAQDRIVGELSAKLGAALR